MRRILRDLRLFELRQPSDSRICICRCVLYFFAVFLWTSECDYDVIMIPLGCFYFSICLIDRAAAWNNGEYELDILEPCTDVRLFSLVY